MLVLFFFLLSVPSVESWGSEGADTVVVVVAGIGGSVVMAAAVAEGGGGGGDGGGGRTEEDPATPSQRLKHLQAEEERDRVNTSMQKEAQQHDKKELKEEEEKEEKVNWQSWVKGITYVFLW